MRKRKVLGWTGKTGIFMIALSVSGVAGFGDAVVGGVVGGVVGSVITNEIYHGHHRTRHHTRHRTHRSVPVMTDEKKIQIALQNLGFYRGPIDGQINAYGTRTAIRELNRAYEIGDTPSMSPQERDALVYLGTLLLFDRNLNAPGTDRRTRTRRIQTALKILGFYNGKLDGSSGPMTRRAIANYRAAYGLAPATRLNFDEEYQLISTAKTANDRNLNDTVASLKRLGASQRTQRTNAVPMMNRGPVILQPSAPARPVQGTIVQQAPAGYSQTPPPAENSAALQNAPTKKEKAVPQPVKLTPAQ